MKGRLRLWLGLSLIGWAMVDGARASQWTSYLSANRIYCIAPGTSQVWVGTSGGLWIFERRTGEWNHQTVQDGLPGHQVRGIAWAGQKVWVATSDGGAGCYDTETGQWLYFGHGSGLPCLDVRAVCVAREAVWFGTNGRGVARYDLITERWKVFTVEDGLASNTITCIAADSQGLWVGTTGGLSRYDFRLAQWTTLRPLGSPLSGALRALWAEEGGVWAVTEGGAVVWVDWAGQRMQELEVGKGFGPFEAIVGEGELLWLGGSNGLAVLDGRHREWRKVPEAIGSVTALALDDTFLWVGTRSDGLQFWNRRTGEWASHRVAEEVPGSEVLCAAADQEGLWFGLQRKGLLLFEPRLHRWQHWGPPECPLQGAVRAIVALGEELWLGTDQGLWRWRRKGGWEHYTSAETGGALPSEDVYEGFLEPGGHRIWWATAQGVCGMEVGSGRWIQVALREELGVGGNLPRFYPDLQGFWVLYPQAALFRSLEGRWTLHRKVFEGEGNLAPPRQRLYDMALDTQSVWFACWDGVRQWERASGQWFLHDARVGVPLQEVRHIAASRRFVWAATLEGLFRYRRANGSWSPVGSKEGYRGDLVTAMAYDMASQRLWIASSNGLSLYDEGRNAWAHFGSASGVVPSARRILLLGPEAWFIGDNGISVCRGAVEGGKEEQP